MWWKLLDGINAHLSQQMIRASPIVLGRSHEQEYHRIQQAQRERVARWSAMAFMRASLVILALKSSGRWLPVAGILVSREPADLAASRPHPLRSCAPRRTFVFQTVSKSTLVTKIVTGDSTHHSDQRKDALFKVSPDFNHIGYLLALRFR